MSSAASPPSYSFARFSTPSTSEQRLVQRALHVGRVVSDTRTVRAGRFSDSQRDCIDAASGAIAIGDYLRPGQTVQFHVRDQAAADAELRSF